MKKLLSILLCFCLLPSCSFCEVDTVELGEFGDLIANIAVYCQHWNVSIGKEFGTDLSLHTEEMYVEKTPEYSSDNFDLSLPYLYNIDGIKADVNIFNNQIYALYVIMNNDKYDSLQASARAAAIISAIAYDFPKSEKELTSRFIILFTQITDWLDLLKLKLRSFGAPVDVVFSVSAEKGVYNFYLTIKDEDVIFSTNRIL